MAENNKDPFDKDKFKKGISYVESGGGKKQWNENSSATGKYQFLYNNIKDLPEMKGVTREQFMANNDLQETIMEMAINNKIRNRPGYFKNAKDLTDEYSNKLGDKWNYRPDEVAALTHFLGRAGTREYLRSIAEGTNYKVAGKVNATVDEYIERYNEGIDSKVGYDPIIQQAKKKGEFADERYPYPSQDRLDPSNFRQFNPPSLEGVDLQNSFIPQEFTQGFLPLVQTSGNMPRIAQEQDNSQPETQQQMPQSQVQKPMSQATFLQNYLGNNQFANGGYEDPPTKTIDKERSAQSWERIQYNIEANKQNQTAFKDSSHQAKKDTAKDYVKQNWADVNNHPLWQAPGMIGGMGAEDIVIKGIGKGLGMLAKSPIGKKVSGAIPKFVRNINDINHPTKKHSLIPFDKKGLNNIHDAAFKLQKEYGAETQKYWEASNNYGSLYRTRRDKLEEFLKINERTDELNNLHRTMQKGHTVPGDLEKLYETHPQFMSYLSKNNLINKNTKNIDKFITKGFINDFEKSYWRGARSLNDIPEGLNYREPLLNPNGTGGARLGDGRYESNSSVIADRFSKSSEGKGYKTILEMNPDIDRSDPKNVLEWIKENVNNEEFGSKSFRGDKKITESVYISPRTPSGTAGFERAIHDKTIPTKVRSREIIKPTTDANGPRGRFAHDNPHSDHIDNTFYLESKDNVINKYGKQLSPDDLEKMQVQRKKLHDGIDQTHQKIYNYSNDYISRSEKAAIDARKLKAGERASAIKEEIRKLNSLRDDVEKFESNAAKGTLGAAGIGSVGWLGSELRNYLNSSDYKERSEFRKKSPAERKEIVQKEKEEKTRELSLGGVSNQFANGGQINNNMNPENFLTEFNSGGSHEQNPMGGIPQGMGENGKMNTVEEGETKAMGYVFSDRLEIDEQTAQKYGLPKNFKGKSPAKASKIINAPYKESTNAVDKESVEEMLGRLIEASEELRQIQEMRDTPPQMMGMENPISQGMGQEMDPSMMEGMDQNMMFLGGVSAGMKAVGPQQMQGAQIATAGVPKMANAASGGMDMSGMSGVIGGAMSIGNDFFGKTGIDTSGNQRIADAPTNGGAALSGAAKGAQAGMALGPWGAAAGAVIGGVGGIVGNSRKQREISEANMNFDMTQNSGHNNTYAFGGEIDPKKGIFLPSANNMDPNMDIAYANSKGLSGQQLSGFEDQNESDKDWRGNRDKFFNEFTTKWKGEGNNHKLSQSSPEYMQMGRDRADAWYKNNPRELNETVLDYRANGPANLSKPIRSNHNSFIPEQSFTGGDSNEFGGGGPLGWNQFDFGKVATSLPNMTGNSNDFHNPQTHKTPVIPAPSTGAPNAGNPINFNAGNQGAYSTSDGGLVDPLNQMADSPKSFWGQAGDFAGKAARYAPIATNAYQLATMKSPDKVSLDRDDSRYNPRYVDEKSLINRNMSDYNSAASSLKDATNGSVGALRNSLASAHLNRAKGLSDSFMQAEGMNSQQNQMAHQFNSQSTRTNIHQSNQEKEINMRNEAAYDNNKSKFISAIGEGVGDIGLEQMRRKYPELAGMGYDSQGRYFAAMEAERKKKEAEKSAKRNSRIA